MGAELTREVLLKAIKKKCLQCSNGQPKEVLLCPVKSCPLYHYRLLAKEGEPKK